jgi:hypothetical protein
VRAGTDGGTTCRDLLTPVIWAAARADNEQLEGGGARTITAGAARRTPLKREPSAWAGLGCRHSIRPHSSYTRSVAQSGPTRAPPPQFSASG